MQQFQRRRHIAQGPRGAGAAAGNDIGLGAAAAQGFRQRVQFRHHVGAAGAVVEGGAEQVVEQHVAVFQIVAVVGLDPRFQQRLAGEAEAGRRRRGLAHMVRLGGALGDQGVCPVLQRFGDQELQLARLVAAAGEAGAVVAFHPQGRAAEMLGEAGQRLQRRRRVNQPDAGKAGEMHGKSDH